MRPIHVPANVTVNSIGNEISQGGLGFFVPGRRSAVGQSLRSPGYQGLRQLNIFHASHIF